MKAFSVLLVLTSATLASANSECLTVAAQIPTCGVSCISSAASVAGCDQTDLACQCSSSQSAAIQRSALDCIVQACGAVDGLQVSSSAVAVCACMKTAAPAQASPTTGKDSITTTTTCTTTTTSPPTSPPKTTSTPTKTGSFINTVNTYSPPNLVGSTTAPVTAVTAGAQTIGAMGGVIGGLLAVVAAL